MKKRIISILLSLVLMLGVFSISAFAKTSEQVDRHLHYNEDGKFTIMQISDLQDFAIMRLPTKELLKAELAANPCDLIILTGDNISPATLTIGSASTAIWQFMSVLEELGTPVAITFGNHDDQFTTASKQTQLKMYEKYKCFVGCAGENFGKSNLCTYYIPIYDSAKSNEVKNLMWIVDSGTYRNGNTLKGYAATTPAQIDWYTRTSQQFEAQYGHKIPGLMFQHIVVPEIWEALQPASSSTPGAVEHNGQYYVLPEGTKGVLGEVPCPPDYTTGQFAAVAERGDVMAMFFGHDHTNTYEIKNFHGVDLVNTPGIGFNFYNSEDVGVRMIYLDKNNPWSYETDVVSYFDVFDYDDAAARYLFKSDSSTSSAATHFAAAFKYTSVKLSDAFNLPCYYK